MLRAPENKMPAEASITANAVRQRIEKFTNIAPISCVCIMDYSFTT
jgi:hypothetical protein